MILRLFSIITIVLCNVAIPHHIVEPTVPIKDRIRLLKHQLKERIKHINSVSTTLANERLDYIDTDKLPITPIMDYDHRKQEEQYWLRDLKTRPTTTEKGWDSDELKARHYHKDNIDQLRSATLHEKTYYEKPMDMFYRRAEAKMSDDDKEQSDTSPTENNGTSFLKKPFEKFRRIAITDAFANNKAVQWFHCQDIITPFLTGVKKELSPGNKIMPTSRAVIGLVQLLATNTSTFDKDEIYAILYQISNLQIRLFQWHLSSIRLLLKTIIKDGKHSFRSLKYGIKGLFNSWHLDFRWNTTKLIQQSRIFRPHCIIGNHDAGSTLSSRGTRYTLPTSATTKAEGCDDDYESRRHNEKENKTHSDHHKHHRKLSTTTIANDVSKNTNIVNATGDD